MNSRLVSIDIEPGGRSRPVGYLGLAELVSGRPGTSWCGRFWSPFAGQEWTRWAFECAADRHDLWAGVLAQAWSEPGHSTLFDEYDDDWAEDASNPQSLPEWMLPEPPSFADTFSVAQSFVGTSVTAAFGAAYDARQIALLSAATGIEAPDWQILDGRQLLPVLGYPAGSDTWTESVVDAFTAGGNTLEATQVRLGLISDVEAAWRFEQHTRWRVGNKRVLHNAEDDAIANAALFETAMRRVHTTSPLTLAQVLDLRCYRTTTPFTINPASPQRDGRPATHAERSGPGKNVGEAASRPSARPDAERGPER